MDDDVQNYGSFHGDGEGYAGRIDVVTGPTGRELCGNLGDAA